MSSKQEQSIQTRRSLIEAAAQEFRVSGYAGAGVDAIAARAGLTSGAFYRHFGSKSEIFTVVIAQGLEQVVAGIRATQAAAPRDWQKTFADFYFSDIRLKAIEDGCALPSLTAEIVRADDNAKEAFCKGIAAIAEALAGDGFPPGDDAPSRRALAALASMAGALMLARAVNSEKLADRIASAAASNVLDLLQGGPDGKS